MQAEYKERRTVSPVMFAPGGAVLNGNLSQSLSPSSSSTAHLGQLLSDTEDIFNADIVCPHGNLRIEERCKQLVSRAAWFRLCNYFDRPKTFQFGRDIFLIFLLAFT
jgi:hypothetical protein